MYAGLLLPVASYPDTGTSQSLDNLLVILVLVMVYITLGFIVRDYVRARRQDPDALPPIPAVEWEQGRADLRKRVAMYLAVEPFALGGVAVFVYLAYVSLNGSGSVFGRVMLTAVETLVGIVIPAFVGLLLYFLLERKNLLRRRNVPDNRRNDI